MTASILTDNHYRIPEQEESTTAAFQGRQLMAKKKNEASVHECWWFDFRNKKQYRTSNEKTKEINTLATIRIGIDCKLACGVWILAQYWSL
ncbi:MAG: hypothetical protein JXR80_00535 [Deltaproteobacteria bacterium]|nr:hypothetical protein [Deltaproteobacteria bacterium]